MTSWKPWQHRPWIFPRDPDFAVKAARVLDLYAGTWQGEPLGEGEFVVCADEKTSIQARCRCHPTLPPGKARMMRVEHEYERTGALAYLAADAGVSGDFGVPAARLGHHTATDAKHVTPGAEGRLISAWFNQDACTGRCTTGIEPFGRLVAQVMTTQPYASADRVHLAQRSSEQVPGMRQGAGDWAEVLDHVAGPRVITQGSGSRCTA